MRTLDSYTDEEKIKLFDKIYKTCEKEWEDSLTPDWDEHYFWEGILEGVLSLEPKDWDEYNERME